MSVAPESMRKSLDFSSPIPATVLSKRCRILFPSNWYCYSWGSSSSGTWVGSLSSEYDNEALNGFFFCLCSKYPAPLLEKPDW